MSDCTAPHTAQPMSSDWAAAFQARFDAICRRFWEHLENRRQPPAPTQVSIMARAPPTQQPAKDLSSEWGTSWSKQLTELPAINMTAHQGLEPPLITTNACEGEHDVSGNMQLRAAPHRGRTQPQK
ncbi:Hypothetical predicted protein [Pelobates cultripes]|uniref:Uncharacterized protein n=1 Tax=Pelobates cultripes TaxID=61616 RepID=A0AAD1S0G3_PELCU|nr:Hypothetical predicted protein [Pelobates cultripes]